MKDYEKIKEFVNEKDNAITVNDFKDAKIKFYYINKLMEDNYIYKVRKGLYAKINSFEDELYFHIIRRCFS